MNKKFIKVHQIGLRARYKLEILKDNFIDEDILKLPNLKEFCVDDRFLPFIVKNKTIFSRILSFLVVF